MNLNTFKYLFSEGLRNVFQNKKTTIASLIITCFTMIIFGVFFIATGNIEKTSDQLTSKQGMEVFLNELDEKNTIRVENSIKLIDGIGQVKYKSKDQALEEAKERFKDTPAMLAGYDENNKLPASFLVSISNLDDSNRIKNELSQIEGVDEVQSKDFVIQVSSYISKVVKVITMVILVFSIIGSVLIISNTIKITVHSRGKEISIMKYVGATNAFIRIPFLVQGALTGLVSAIISTIIIGIVYRFAINSINNSILSSLATVSPQDMIIKLFLIFLGLGIGIGIVGSYISMKKYLKV